MQYLFLQPRFASSSITQAISRSENLRRTEEINMVLLKLWRRPIRRDTLAQGAQGRLKVEMRSAQAWNVYIHSTKRQEAHKKQNGTPEMESRLFKSVHFDGRFLEAFSSTTETATTAASGVSTAAT